MKFWALSKEVAADPFHPVGAGKPDWSDRVPEGLSFMFFMVYFGIFRSSNGGI